MRASSLDVAYGSIQGRSKYPEWSVSFWALLKALCLYNHRVVVAPRVCLYCYLKYREEHLVDQREGAKEGGLEWLTIEYEPKIDSRAWRGDDSEMFLGEDERSCDVCDNWWWNNRGVCERYTERDIGVGRWNHRGSGLLSLCLLLFCLSLLLYYLVSFTTKLWGMPDHILLLVRKMTLFIAMAIHPSLALCSLLRSRFKSVLPHISWATTLNVRYLLKRAQMMDIGRKGLPGKPFLAACVIYPLAISAYRALLHIFVSGCPYTTYSILTYSFSVVVIEYWGLFTYLLYFIRVSFQRQFSVLTSYIKRHEGETEKCRGALFTTAVDFCCFRELINIYSFVMLPVVVFSAVTFMASGYTSRVECVAYDPHNVAYYRHELAVYLLELMTLLFYITSIGGIRVDYLLHDFFFNLVYTRSHNHRAFWHGVLKDVSYLLTSSYALLLTVVFSVISMFMGLNFSSEQYFVNLCNGTHVFCNV